jgi:fatty acid desaturase
MGGLKVINMKYHLVIDILAAALLALSPWLFGFANEAWNAWVPHVVVGLAVILVVICSKTQPGTDNVVA